MIVWKVISELFCHPVVTYRGNNLRKFHGSFKVIHNLEWLTARFQTAQCWYISGVSHSESSFSAKTWQFELSSNFLNRELHRLQHIEKWQEFMQLLAGIQKFTLRTRVFQSHFQIHSRFSRKNTRQPNVDQRKSCSPNCHENFFIRYFWFKKFLSL